VGLRAVLDAAAKRKIPSPCRELNPIPPACSPVAITVPANRLDKRSLRIINFPHIAQHYKCQYEGVTKSFRTESINIRLPLVLLVAVPFKGLWRRNSLD
jgi:hypothetical protein